MIAFITAAGIQVSASDLSFMTPPDCAVRLAHHSLTIFKAICITVGFRKISESDPLRFNHHSNLILG